jgi:ubiquinone/menaquinone biosynthesis C-methylase UbiE
MAINQLEQETSAVASAEQQPTKLNSKENLFSSYLRIFREFRRHDLTEFCDRHAELYADALASKNHLKVTQHYYGLMADVIETYYGDGWHFCPPEYEGQNRSDSTVRMYNRVSELLQLSPDDFALDVGCGVGGMLRHVARHSGARLTGITLGDNEVVQANQLIGIDGLDDRCRVVQGDSQAMPFESSSFDGVYAVYALKYYPDLSRVLGEIQRVLKPGGRFVAYCLCKSKKFDSNQISHRRLLNEFEYSTGMPPLQSVQSIIAAAAQYGLKCIADDDLSQDGLTWYSFWVRNPLLPWVVSSRAIYGLVKSAEAVRILPKGFARFNDTFLAGTLRHIIQGGKTGILTGSALLTFERAE